MPCRGHHGALPASQAGARPGCRVPQPPLGAGSPALSPRRQCCSGKELVDWLLGAGLAVQTRSQAVGICQVLVDGGVLTHGEGGRWQPPAPRWGLGALGAAGVSRGCSWYPHGSPMGARPCSRCSPPAVKQEWHFQDKDTQFYRFAELELSPEPGAGLRDAEELLEALAFLAQLGPDALLTMALRKP